MMTITTSQQFADWLKSGPKICIYHTGNLADDRYRASANNNALGHLARAVWTAAVNREVYLLQRKYGDEPAQYLAVRPKDGKVPLRFAPGFAEAAPCAISGHHKKGTP